VSCSCTERFSKFQEQEMPISLTIFQGRAGDHNDLAIPGAKSIGDLLAHRFGLEATVIGSPEHAISANWRVEIDCAMTTLQEMQDWVEQIFTQGHRPLSATSRCAVSLATLPVIAKHCRDVCVVWFDAHADLNTPDSSTTGYLGGLSLSGSVGLWDSGLGSGLSLDNVILVGQRDLDPFELELINSGQVRLIRPGYELASELQSAVAGRPVYMHLDCDVLNPGIVPTDYVCPGGLSLEDLRNACIAISHNEVVGVEIAEFQDSWKLGEPSVSPIPLIDALEPVLNQLRLC
jgi:arginase